jgi:transposase
MEHYAGIDVSLESVSICVVDASGRIIREAKVASEPEVLITWFSRLEVAMTRIGLEAGPLSQWLYAGMREAGASGGVARDPACARRLQGNASEE